MAIHLAVCTWEGVSNLPEDRIVNTWHFDGSGDFDNVADMLDDFYNTVPASGGSNTIAKFMTVDAMQDDLRIDIYDLSDPIPRVPVYTTTRTMIGMLSSGSLPRETALCLSYQGIKVSGVNQASRRGRVYLGGLAATANASGRPTSPFTTCVAEKGEDLLSASIASVSWSWVVYSPTLLTSTPVVSGWCDDAWDTQRRRGLRPTTKKLFP